MKPSAILILLLLFVHGLAFGQDIPDPMSPPRLVNDFAGIYSDNDRNSLEQMLRNYNDTTSTQIYVVTIKDLGGYDISDYASRLGEKWKVGKKGKDNGAVILIKPRIGNERGKVFIATGYGLEPVLTDARVGRIIDKYMIPYFMEGEYYAGTKTAVEAIIGYLSGQFQADEAEDDGRSSSTIMWVIAIIVFIAVIVYANRKGNNDQDDDSSNTGGGGFFPPIFPRGRGGFGGGSSGGFGGGGGGRFGGGGAGRSW